MVRFLKVYVRFIANATFTGTRQKHKRVLK